MRAETLIKATPWDTVAFDIPTWELLEYSREALQLATQTKGHHTIKVDPLADKRLLQEYGFYYCDTLIEPVCSAARLRAARSTDATISRDIDTGTAMAICHGAFAHGRFHRDYNLSRPAADLRYDNWLRQLLEERQVYGLYWQDECAGFIGYRDNRLLLHAVANEHRGKGRSKFWWAMVCGELLASGNNEIRSSISAANLAVVNLYASLGFIFEHPRDVYHRLTQD